MLTQLRDFIRDEGWSDIVVLPFFSMVDRRKALHHAVIEIERMTVLRAPLPGYAPKSGEGHM